MLKGCWTGGNFLRSRSKEVVTATVPDHSQGPVIVVVLDFVVVVGNIWLIMGNAYIA